MSKTKKGLEEVIYLYNNTGVYRLVVLFFFMMGKSRGKFYFKHHWGMQQHESNCITPSEYTKRIK